MRKEAMSDLDGGMNLAKALPEEYEDLAITQFKKTGSDFAAIQHGIDGLNESSPQAVAEAKQYYDQASKAAQEASDLQTSLTVEAHEFGESEKRYYFLAKFAGYLFFGFGACLNFYGIVSGKAEGVVSS